MKSNTREFYDCEGVRLLDLGIGDVHTPGSSSEPDDGPKWIQLAKQGAFAGHPAGPFKLDLKTFNEIIANFKATQNRAIPLDYEHASEQDPTSGSIPTSGSPACGWVTDLEIREGNLWGLCSWSDQAREQIRSGGYRFLSPAIRFGSKDRVTGANIGARLTSAALTNMPFLDGMAPLAASTKTTPDGRPALARCMTDMRTALEAHAPKGTTCGDLHYSAHALLACLDDMPADGESAAMRLRDAEGQAASSTLLLRQANATIATQAEELIALRDEKTKRDEADLHEEVRTVMETYADMMKYGDADLPLLLSWARSDRKSFRERHPPVRLSERVLLRQVAPPNPRPQPPPRELEGPALVKQIQSERGLSLSDAEIEARQVMRARRRRAAAAEGGGIG